LHSSFARFFIDCSWVSFHNNESGGYVKNFILICIDCLRYDIFKKSLSGHPIFSKFIDSNGIAFDAAYTTAPWTYPSSNSILTGLYPCNHGAYQEGIYKNSVKEPWPQKLKPDVSTIFSDLNKLGYFNLGISTIFWALNENCEYKGCDKIIRSEEQDIFYKNVEAEWVVNAFKESFIKDIGNQPFFSYLHLCDLHRPFELTIAKEYSKGHVEILDGIEEWDMSPYLADPKTINIFKTNKLSLYCSLVNYVFVQIQDLISFLMEQDIFEDTTIIITADHGEEFWDHEEFEKINYDCGHRSKKEWLIGTGHGHTLFNEVVHVPLIIINPGFEFDLKSVKTPVSLVDIYPTIMDILENTPSGKIDGVSLKSPTPNREILIESTLYGYERKALISDSVKHIYSPFEKHYAKYDLLNDHSETLPISNEPKPQIAARLEELFASTLT
jgi:Sulfatase